MSEEIPVAVVGIGKIARDQHLPSIARNGAFRLAAAVSRHATVEGVETFRSLDALFDSGLDVAMVALCTPPQVRYEGARKALDHGKHVLLEKPPGATLSEVEDLAARARERGVSLFATWHSRFAPAVAPARDWLSDRTITGVSIMWKEDVRHWHPGQAWIWKAGGLGVFDPGINALSILTAILPRPIHLREAELTFPENCETPIAARLAFADPLGTPIAAELDWRQTGPQTWDIIVATTAGTLTLSAGGSVLQVDGETVHEAAEAEYDGIYARAAELVRAGASDVDVAPLRHVADAFLLGRRVTTEPFFDKDGA